MAPESKPFIFTPFSPIRLPRMRVSASCAADLVSWGAHCHQFRASPQHSSPNLSSLREMVNDLQLSPEDGESYLMQECLREALQSAERGRYGVGAVLATARGGVMNVVCRAQNEREKGGKHEYMGHAETRLVDVATQYLQNTSLDHSTDTVAVSLCPCPGCLGLMVDTHIPTTLIGSIDPEVGAAFLHGRKLQYALGSARMQVMTHPDRPLTFRFPTIPDAQLRERILSLSWDVFHSSRATIHQQLHNETLQE